MSSENLLPLTEGHGFDEGVQCVLLAQETSDWKPVVDWLSKYHDQAEQLLDFIGGQRKLLSFLDQHPVRSARETEVGNIQLGKSLGSGAMGVVYRGFDAALKRDVAVKFVRNEHGLSGAELGRLRREGEIVASLSHPNIVSVLSFGESESGPYLVMPLLAGGTLADRMKAVRDSGKFDLIEAATLMRDVALGAHHAHQRGLIHRDLKPANILLDESGTPKIADFGLARRTDGNTGSSAGIAGTFAYMASEQARGDRFLTTAVDVHAIGVILFEMIAGQVPYGTDANVIFRKLTDPRESPPRLSSFCSDAPVDLEAICQKCLEKDPDHRYASGRELAEDLERFITGKQVLARPRSFLEIARHAMRRPAETKPYVTASPTIFTCFYTLAIHLIIMLMILLDASQKWIFGVFVAHLVSWIAQVAWFFLRRMQTLNEQERMAQVLHFAAWIGIATLIPLQLSFFGMDLIPLYPVMNFLLATGFFVMGAIHSGRQYSWALGVSSLNLLLPWIPFWSWPLTHAVACFITFAMLRSQLIKTDAAARDAASDPQKL